MNEEEKKVIEFLKENMLDYEEIDTSILLDINSKHKTILNLIEKLQKENELAKKQVEYDKTHICTPQTIKLNYIPIQKVKDKIRHYQELQDNYIKKYDETNEGLQAMINVLQELLEGKKENGI